MELCDILQRNSFRKYIFQFVRIHLTYSRNAVNDTLRTIIIFYFINVGYNYKNSTQSDNRYL